MCSRGARLIHAPVSLVARFLVALQSIRIRSRTARTARGRCFWPVLAMLMDAGAHEPPASDKPAWERHSRRAAKNPAIVVLLAKSVPGHRRASDAKNHVFEYLVPRVEGAKREFPAVTACMCECMGVYMPRASRFRGCHIAREGSFFYGFSTPFFVCFLFCFCSPSFPSPRRSGCGYLIKAEKRPRTWSSPPPRRLGLRLKAAQS